MRYRIFENRRLLSRNVPFHRQSSHQLREVANPRSSSQLQESLAAVALLSGLHRWQSVHIITPLAIEGIGLDAQNSSRRWGSPWIVFPRR